MRLETKKLFSSFRRVLRPAAAPEVLAECTRDGLVESLCRGALVVSDAQGNVLAQVGEAPGPVFLRSCAKPFQAIPLLSSGAADFFGLSAAEIAVICGSHQGEAIHTQAVQRILAKAGLTPAALHCGPPQQGKGEGAAALAHNCSGKHAGMLCLARYLGARTEDYEKPGHPVQRQIAEALCLFSGLKAADLAWGTDGCGAPAVAMPLAVAARMAACLAQPPESFAGPLALACQQAASAMLSHPEMVGGSAGNFDTELMRHKGAGLLSKCGAEGVYLAALLPGPQRPAGLGLAFKIESGDPANLYRPVVAMEALRQLGAFAEGCPVGLAPFAGRPLRNSRGEETGRIQAAFNLRGRNAAWPLPELAAGV